jgi:hypothetical protein
MRSRVLQVVILVVLGGALGLLLTRDWRTAEPAAAVPAPAVEPQSAAAKPAASEAQTNTEADVPPPPVREFKLPAMPRSAPAPAAVAAVNKEPAPAKDPPATVRVPRFWLLRGTAVQNYDVLSDRGKVKSGAASVLIRSHARDIHPGLTGSVMQSVLAESLLGKRIEVSAYLRAEEVRERTVALWFTALDANNLLLATDNSSKQFPKITGDWTRVHFVIEVPWATTQAHYGVTLTGPGAVWMDDVRLTPVDRTVVTVTNAALPRQFGQRIEVANVAGPSTRPENLDFEETTDVPAPPREGGNLSAIRQ